MIITIYILNQERYATALYLQLNFPIFSHILSKNKDEEVVKCKEIFFKTLFYFLIQNHQYHQLYNGAWC